MCWPGPMRSAPWVSTGAPPAGRSRRWARSRCRCSPPPMPGPGPREGCRSSPSGTPPPCCRPCGSASNVVEDYASLSLSLKRHPVALLRDGLAAAGFSPAEMVGRLQHGRRIAMAGLVLVRQRPGSANGVIFITLEDETGVTNLVIMPPVFEAFRREVMVRAPARRQRPDRTADGQRPRGGASQGRPALQPLGPARRPAGRSAAPAHRTHRRRIAQRRRQLRPPPRPCRRDPPPDRRTTARSRCPAPGVSGEDGFGRWLPKYHRHSREGGNPGNPSSQRHGQESWFPAFAGMTTNSGQIPYRQSQKKRCRQSPGGQRLTV